MLEGEHLAQAVCDCLHIPCSEPDLRDWNQVVDNILASEKEVTIAIVGGFGKRGTEGKILAIEYARTHKLPFLGICLGMQLAIVEFARNVLDLYRKPLEDAGMILSGLSPDGQIVEMIELADHPYFIAIKAHPEFKSRPNRVHPLFQGLVKAATSFYYSDIFTTSMPSTNATEPSAG